MNRISNLVLLAIAMTGSATAQTTAGTPPADDAPATMPQTAKVPPEERARNEAAYAAYFKAPDTEGTGPFPAIKEEEPSLPDHVVYRPKDLSKVGKG